MSDQNLTDVPDNIATAPGDLPYAHIIQRISLQQEQFRHDNTIAPLAPTPEDAVQIFATSGSKLAIKSAAVWYTTDGRIPDSQSETISMQLNKTDWNPHAHYIHHWNS